MLLLDEAGLKWVPRVGRWRQRSHRCAGRRGPSPLRVSTNDQGSGRGCPSRIFIPERWRPAARDAVGKTPGEPAGSLLRVGSEIGHLMRRGMSVRPDAVAHSRSDTQICERRAAFRRRLFPTASDEGSGVRRLAPMAARYRERQQETASGSANSAARRSPASRSPDSPKRSGTCSRPTGPSPRQVAQTFWPPDGPPCELDPASEPSTNLIRLQPAMERGAQLQPTTKGVADPHHAAPATGPS
jgi:hypothetical protein